MLAERVDYVIGVDTHRDQHTLAVVAAPTGAVLAQMTVRTDAHGYREALRFVGERTPRATITISSDHDFRNLMLLNYYGRELPAKRIVYFTADAWPEGGPEWYIAHRQNPAGVPPGALQTGGCATGWRGCSLPRAFQAGTGTSISGVPSGIHELQGRVRSGASPATAGPRRPAPAPALSSADFPALSLDGGAA